MRAGGRVLITDGITQGEKVLTTRFEEIAEGVLVNIP
jgi:hypothetical protein